MSRQLLLNQIDNNTFDVIVIGGGATGLGCAVEAVTRGYKTLLVEAADYTAASSSRSTKLLHGGVRYLAKGDVALVKAALRERALTLKHAPHLSHECSFIIPTYNTVSTMYYTTGLKAYDLLAGSLNLTPSKRLSKDQVLKMFPKVCGKHLKAGVRYSDGVFDDSRMAISLLRTFISYGGIASNYLKVINLIKQNDKIVGVELEDRIDKSSLITKASCVINATGIFADELMKLDNVDAQPVIKWAQGIHLVIDKKHCNTNNALLIPKTPDKRVLFLVPWHNKVLVGTTDTAVMQSVYEPRALNSEIEYVVKTANQYLNTPISYDHIDSIYAGIRPLVMDHHSRNTASLSRDDKKFISASGLVTIVGGKWTTYRKMGETTIDFAIEHNLLKASKSKTTDLLLHGYLERSALRNIPENLRVYGSDYQALMTIPSSSNILSEKLNINEAQIEYAVKYEQACCLEDFLSRRTRCLFLDYKETIQLAPKVVRIMSKLLNKHLPWENEQLSNFERIAANYNIENYDM